MIKKRRDYKQKRMHLHYYHTKWKDSDGKIWISNNQEYVKVCFLIEIHFY